MSRRVAVTGLGVCSSVGCGVPKFWDALVSGRSGIDQISAFDASSLRSQIAGEVTDFDPKGQFDRKIYRRTARYTQLALAAAYEAVAQSGIDQLADRENVGVVVGTGIGGINKLLKEYDTFKTRGPGKFPPLTLTMVIPNMAAGVIAIETGCRGPNLCVTTACATGSHAIGTALDLIRAGRTDVVITGGAEATIGPYPIDGYCQLRALSTRNDEPQRASRPFDVDRDGFVIAEGAGIIVLESLEHALGRGANVLAELAGYGATGDGHHATAPDPDGRGAVRAMRAALADASTTPGSVDLVNAHGTGTELNDPTETAAIREVFGDHAYRLAVQATKSMTGHALGASAAIEAVAVVKAIETGVIHPTINLEQPDPACDLDYVPHRAREAEVRCVMTNAFGFGGHNAVLVFKRFDG